jgi:hypothetical protein
MEFGSSETQRFGRMVALAALVVRGVVNAFLCSFWSTLTRLLLPAAR